MTQGLGTATKVTGLGAAFNELIINSDKKAGIEAVDTTKKLPTGQDQSLTDNNYQSATGRHTDRASGRFLSVPITQADPSNGKREIPAERVNTLVKQPAQKECKQPEGGAAGGQQVIKLSPDNTNSTLAVSASDHQFAEICKLSKDSEVEQYVASHSNGSKLLDDYLKSNKNADNAYLIKCWFIEQERKNPSKSMIFGPSPRGRSMETQKKLAEIFSSPKK